jgi:hypothetical protein
MLIKSIVLLSADQQQSKLHLAITTLSTRHSAEEDAS